MATVPHPNGTTNLPTPADHATYALGYEPSDVLHAWQTACRAAAEALPAAHDAERVRKALRLAHDGAVTLHDLGLGGRVQSGAHTYHVQPDGQGCDCPDATHRSHACKHALAVHLHRRALERLGVAAEAAPSAPLSSPPPPQPAASGPASAHWDVHEAPISSCFRYRVGALEWTYTIRGATDAEVHTRLRAFLPTFQETVAEMDTLHAAREAARQAAASAPQPDLAALVQQAVQQALHQAQGQAAPAAPAASAADDQASGVCSRHQVAMEPRTDTASGERWYSHYDEETGRYCKGQRPSRRPRR